MIILIDFLNFFLKINIIIFVIKIIIFITIIIIIFISIIIINIMFFSEGSLWNNCYSQ